MQRAGHPGPSLKCTGGRVMGMQFKQWLISVFSLACPAMHNRQSAPSHTGVATNGQLLIIVLLNTQFSQPGTDCSAGAIIMVKNKAKQCYVSEKRETAGGKEETMRVGKRHAHSVYLLIEMGQKRRTAERKGSL